jgi:hypothetical protein
MTNEDLEINGAKYVKGKELRSEILRWHERRKILLEKDFNLNIQARHSLQGLLESVLGYDCLDRLEVALCEYIDVTIKRLEQEFKNL